ncbi:transcription factor bHLH123-like isoform X2 [Lycium barbarum]|uniref:transcription factor bHLH123-like isoform X2 n=1 Tax=Lycium barbarum TaxID=112863 RepID=UPI00293EECD8|nr:transcription factor bHLH123-like isoform X2 [Lycium barbarum]
MAEEFQLGRGNWWESSTSSSTTTSSSRNKFIESGISLCTTPSASSTTLGSMGSNFVWPTEIEDIKARSDNSSMVFPADSQRSYTTESSIGGGGGGGGVGRGVLSANHNLQMMGLGLSPQGLDWNQPFLGEKSGSGFRSILQEGLSSNANYQQEGTCHEQDHNWSTTQKIYHGNSDDSSVNDYNKQIMNRGISLDHQSQVFSGHNLENSAAYGSPSNMLQGLLISDNSQQQESNHFTSASRSLYYNPSYNNQSNCDVNIPPTSVDAMPTSSSSSSSWSKFPQFLRTSDPPKQQWPLPQPPPHGQSSHFSGGTPFWNATSAAANDVRSSFIPSLHPQLANPMVDEKPKHTAEVRNISTIAKKANSTETSNKRPRNEAPSPLPAFKARKEKMGDRITALQQLVSPFGKTDTASVLSEAIEYIKFLHEQVNVLSTPYMKSGASMQQSGDKSNVNPEGGKQDLRSRGLCLVPVSSTFPVTHETTVDFWTPTFGGTFR